MSSDQALPWLATSMPNMKIQRVEAAFGSLFDKSAPFMIHPAHGPRGAIIQVHGVGPNNLNAIQPISTWKAPDGGVLYMNPNDPIFDYCPADGGVGDGGCGGAGDVVTSKVSNRPS